MKKFLFLIFFILFGLSPVFAYDYTIDAYDVKMLVNEDKTFNIAETITTYFNVPKHGIYRDIPLSGTLTRTDGTRNAYRAEIGEIFVSEMFTKNRTGSSLRIKIGNPNVTLTGIKKYEIKYKYFMGNDPLKNKDEFYFNIIGSSWDTQIKNVTFAIKFPKPFDASKIGFSAGRYGKAGTDKVRFRVDDNTIYGRYYGVLSPKGALTIRIELPQGYFTNKFTFDPVNFLFFAPLIFLIISYLMWFLYGRDKKTFEVLDFNPPDGINPLEMAYIHSQSITSQDVSTLLIYLASKGYIGIEEVEQNNKIFEVFNIKDYMIKKTKPYDGNDMVERIFMQKLFSYGDTIMLSEISAKIKLYEIVDEIKKNIKTSNTVFEKVSLKNQILVAVFMVLSFVSINFAYCYQIGMLIAMIHATVFPMVGYILLVNPVIRFLCLGSLNHDTKNVLFGVFWSIITLSVLGPLLFFMENDLKIYYVLGIVCIILMNFIYFYMPKWTEKGRHLYGRILGFKKYLNKVEVKRLQKLVDEDPQYFYNILPFAFVLGLSKKWMKKFENIACEPPSYYHGSNYSHAGFTCSINSIMSHTATSCTSPSSSGGGGGSSGGGGGGGGGGGW